MQPTATPQMQRFYGTENYISLETTPLQIQILEVKEMGEQIGY
jgi:hypothetical protein